MTRKKIIVIGGGPAGLMAAGQAAAAGVETLLLEKMKRPGRKLCITGKGRCNITNTADLDDFLAHFGETGDFLRHTFSQFFNRDLMAFLEQSGLNLETERGGRVFPASGKAPDVLAAFSRWIADCGAQLKYSTPVDKLLVSDGRVSGVVSRGRKYACAAAILATGGASYPATGSTGDGYRIAASVGHTIVPIRPALVPLTIEGEQRGNHGRRQPAKHKRAPAHRRQTGTGSVRRGGLYQNRHRRAVLLTLSGQAVDAIDAGRKVAFSLDLKPALSEEKLDARISLRPVTEEQRSRSRAFCAVFCRDRSSLSA